jgi:Zn-dependent protease
MRDLVSWSVNLRRWRGVQLRMHAFCLALVVAVLYLTTRHPEYGLLRYGLVLLPILLVSLLLHEIGHALAAVRVGGHVDQIVIWPLGGLAWPQVPREPQAEMVVALAGPLVNLLVCSIVRLGILWVDQDQELLGLLHPLNPHVLLSGRGWVVALKLTFWVNWVLVLVNAIPAFPLDGGHILRSLLQRWLNYRTAGQVVTWSGKLSAAVLCIMAWMSWLHESHDQRILLPDWMLFISLAILLYFFARQEMTRLEEAEMDDELSGAYDFSQGYTSLERQFDRPRRDHSQGALRRWLEQRQQARLRKQKIVEEEEERRVDEILMRLHEGGMTGLSSKDRALLDRVSARYRNRQGS